MADIKTNTDRMRTDVEGLSGAVDRINNLCNDLQQKKENLDSMWDGPASEAFKDAFQGDLTALTAMIENLKRMYRYEGTAREKYDNCENQIAGMISEL